MEPIISPLTIYLIGIIQHVGLLAGVSVLILLGNLLVALSRTDVDLFKQIEGGKWKFPNHMRRWKRSVIFFAVSVTILIALPSEKTIWKMYAAKHATPDNISKLKDAIGEMKNEVKTDFLDIVHAIDNIGEDEEVEE